MSAPGAPLRRRTGPVVWGIRGATLAMAIACAVIGLRKFRPSDEQVALRVYVENEVPALLDRERAVQERLDRLSAVPGPSAVEARALLVDDVVPRLIALRAQAAAVVANTPALARASADYLAYLDALLDACRISVRTIDDASVSGAAGQKRVREKFLAAGAASRAWRANLERSCEQAGLTAPRR